MRFDIDKRFEKKDLEALSLSAEKALNHYISAMMKNVRSITIKGNEIKIVTYKNTNIRWMKKSK